jgi:MOSC domain-containing protein YiiM
VRAICLSQNKGEVKHPVPEAEFKRDWGLVGDAHAGPWARQVSLLASESIEKFKKVFPELKAGAFAENVITEGVQLKRLALGDRLRLGEKILLQVTQIGKECHNGCAIRETTGDCIMPREGIFCRVLRGGILRLGDPAEPSPPQRQGGLRTEEGNRR